MIDKCEELGKTRTVFSVMLRNNEVGDGMMGLTYHELVLMFAVLPASVIGSIMRVFWER